MSFQHPILDLFIQEFKKENEFDRTQDMSFEIHSPGDITYTMNVGKQHLSFKEFAHGGSLSGLMDATLGLAALSLSVTQEMLVSTVEFKMNFIRPVHLNDVILGKGKVDHEGKKLIIATAHLYDKKTEEVVATGLGTFNKYPMSKKGL